MVDSFPRAEIELFEKTISAVQKLGAVIYNKDRDSVRVEQLIAVNSCLWTVMIGQNIQGERFSELFVPWKEEQ